MKTFTKHTMKTLSMLVIAGGVLFGGMTGNVQAGDKKIYSAVGCKYINGSSYGSVTLKYDNGAIKNVQEDGLPIVCPVIRDNTYNANGLKAWGVVGNNMNHTGERFRCKLISTDSLKSRKIEESVLTLAYGNGSRTFEDKRKTPRKSLRGGRSSYHLFCLIPGWGPSKEPSSLISYWVEEWDLPRGLFRQ